MSELYVFDTGMTQVVSDDPELNEIRRGLTSSFVFAQDNANGFPSYGTLSADRVYKDSYPQRIVATEAVRVGQLLNIFYDDYPKARLATASDKDRFANSMALSPGNPGELITCAVKVGVVPHQSTGTLWLSVAPGETTQTPEMRFEIIQKVGEAKAGIFYFYFHTPAFTNPANHQYLSRGN